MDNKTLQDGFRSQLTNVHAATVATVSLFEIIGYIILIASGIEYFSVNNVYLWRGVVIPIVINVTTHLIARAIVQSKKVNRKKKNGVIIAATLVTSLVVALCHKEYSVTGCAFVFPMILSAMFNDRKLLNASFITSLGILVCVALAFLVEKTISLAAGLNLFILGGFVMISYFCGIISINFSRLNYKTIKAQAETNDKLQEDVLRDQMTGLYNHSAFTDHLEQIISAPADSEPFCMVMVDVDDFKCVNDTYGHDCGDDVLIHVAQTIRKYCGETDTAYRYGGEEFAILCRRKDAARVSQTMDAMLWEVANHKFAFTDKAITFSAGIAQYQTGMTAEALFEAADQTLYRAKKEGKNRVLVDRRTAVR